MIRLENLSKSFTVKGRTTIVARDVTVTFPSRESIALLGHNGAGKSTLLRMIAGVVRPDRGRVATTGSVSWPVGFSGSFHGDMTGAQNVKFVARIYGVDTDEMVRFCGDFAELESHYFLPVRTYSSGMRSRLAFAMSMAIPFDTYLIDEITAVGDASFKKKSEALLRDRLRQSAAIFVSHSTEQMERMCQSGAVLQEGRMFYYNDVKKASEHYSYTIKRQLPPWLRKKS